MGNKTKSRSMSLAGGRKRSRSMSLAGGRKRSRRRSLAGGRKRSRSRRRSLAAGRRRSRGRGRSRKMSGGDASTWVETNFGGGDQQFNKVFLGNGPTDNAIQPLNATASQAQQPNLSLIQSAGGKRRRQRMGQRMSRRMSRTKRGGYLGSVLGTAAAPLALFGLSYKYGRRRSK
jgi:hypothetical protein